MDSDRSRSQWNHGLSKVLTFLSVLLLIFACSFNLASCQDVDIRAPSGDKLTNGDGSSIAIGGTSSRAVHSPRLTFTPHHQIMHFGKRPSVPLPSVVSANNVYDLYLQQQQQQQQQQANPIGVQQTSFVPRFLPSKLPSWFNLRLERGKTLEPLEEDMTTFEFRQPFQAINRMPIYSIIGDEPNGSDLGISQKSFNTESLIGRLLQDPARSNQGLGSKFSRLIEAVADASGSGTNSQANSSGENDGDLTNGLDGQLEPNIQVVARSPHSQSRLPSLANKSYLSSLLLGRSGVPSLSSQNFGTFIKKAEPKDNVFMHFGRK